MSLDYALRRVANQLERQRERINRKRAFIVRCERIAASDDIDDSLLAELLSEGFDDHKLSKRNSRSCLG